MDRASNILKNKDITKIPFAAEFFEKKGAYFFNFRRYSEAEMLFLKALDQNIEDGSFKIDIYNTLGLIQRIINNRDSAVYYFYQGLKIAEKTNNKRWIGIINGNIGYNYYLNNDFGKAKSFLLIDKKLSLENKESESALNAISLLVEVELTERNYDMVEENMKLMDSLIKKLKIYQLGHNITLQKHHIGNILAITKRHMKV